MFTLTYACPEDSTTMQPTLHGRFCSLCQEEVIDFTNKTNEEILALIATQGKSFCAKSTPQRLDDLNRYRTLHQHPLRKQAGILLLTLLLAGCSPTPPPTTQTPPISVEIKNASLTTDIVIDAIQSIPSPLEISFLVDSLENQQPLLQPQQLRPIQSLANLSSEQLGFLYGQYCISLCYAYLHNDPTTVQNYYRELQKIEQSIGLVVNPTDRALIDRLLAKKGLKNLDSLLNTAQKNFERFAYETRIQQQHEVWSVNVLAGGFLEATYFLTEIYKKTKSTRLREKIAENKLSIEQICLILGIYKAKNGTIYDDFMNLYDYYDKVTLIITKRQSPIISRHEGAEIGVVEDVCWHKASISDQDFQAICEATKALREKYTK